MLLGLQPAVIFSLVLPVLVDLDLFYPFTVMLLGLQKGKEIKACVQPTLLHHRVFEREKNLAGKWTGASVQGSHLFPGPRLHQFR